MYKVLVLLSLIFSCSIDHLPTKKVKGYIISEYKVELKEGTMQQGYAKIELKDLVLKQKSEVILFGVSGEVSEILKNSKLIFSGYAKYNGSVKIYDRNMNLINSYTVYDGNNQVEIFCGITEDNKIWIFSNKEVNVRTKDGVLVKSPVLSVGFYPEVYFSKQDFLIKSKQNEEGVLVIDDIKMVVSSFGKVYLKYQGELVIF